ncbi:hypothetical protein AAHH67_19190 [Niallia circulans]
MTNHIKFQWRVTKYNPAFRDENGYFTLTEEWTSLPRLERSLTVKIHFR